jgi:hypothetical protein
VLIDSSVANKPAKRKQYQSQKQHRNAQINKAQRQQTQQHNNPTHDDMFYSVVVRCVVLYHAVLCWVGLLCCFAFKRKYEYMFLYIYISLIISIVLYLLAEN